MIKIQMAIAIMMMRRILMVMKDYISDKDFIQTACKW